MASLALNRLLSAPSNRPTTPSSLQQSNSNTTTTHHPTTNTNSTTANSNKPNATQNNVYRHQHSHSTSTAGNQALGSFFSTHHSGARSAGGPRQSLDVTKSLAVNGPISPRLSTFNSLRPNSEILTASNVNGNNSANVSGPNNMGDEAEAIDKWFEDLQSYEATLEEMAAASLDVNFKEELNAIEQWFRVLSEAERTAALYSLIQSSTQVQIRFFITVLQQMARSDPMIALLSPALHPSTPSMGQQMDVKLSQMGKKSLPSPIIRQFAHQSLTPNVNVTSSENFLSPNSAMFNDSNNMNDPATLLSAQRAKLNAKSSNRLSAPGQILGIHNSLKSPTWNSVPGPVEEEAQSRASSPRPKSTGGDFNLNTSQALHPTLSRTASSTSGIESQLSPIMGGSWASQVNTPLVPMFGNKDKAGNQNSDSSGEAANRLAQWGAAHQAGFNVPSVSSPTLASSSLSASQPPLNSFPLDDARKFRRQSKSAGAGAPNGFSGALPGNNSNSTGEGQGTAHSVSLNAPNQGIQHRIPNSANAPRSALANGGGPLSSPMNHQSLLAAQQQAAVVAQQNWRNGLSSLSSMNSPDPVMVNNLAMMNTLAGLNGGMNVNGIANLAAMANISDPAAFQNMANLLNMRQQMQQVQNLHSLHQLQQSGIMGNGPILSPASGRLGGNFGFPSRSPNGHANKRGATRGPGKPSHTPGSGSNPDEELDMKLLNDIPAWLRGLRLHKYTPNFVGCTWQEMVLMSDATLEARGVAAVGARRKMLRTFETVRIIKGMALPGDGDDKSTPNIDETSANRTPEPTNISPPESDRDTSKN